MPVGASGLGSCPDRPSIETVTVCGPRNAPADRVPEPADLGRSPGRDAAARFMDEGGTAALSRDRQCALATVNSA